MEKTAPAGEQIFIHAVKLTAEASLEPLTEVPTTTGSEAPEPESGESTSDTASQATESPETELPLGLVKEKGRWYYYAEPGVRFKGWLQTEEGYSYFDEARVTGLRKIDGEYYYFRKGIMATGRVVFLGFEMFFDELSGKRLWSKPLMSQWNQEDEPGGEVKEKHGAVEGKLYNQGQLLTGYVQLDGQWYLADEKGQLLSGKQLVEGKWRYFLPNGPQAYGFIETAGDCYFADEEGVLCEGFVLTDGVLRYFDPGTLAMVRNTVVGAYQVDAGGKCTKKAVEVTDANLDDYIDSILAEIGRSPRAIYDYVCQNYVYVVMGWDSNRNMAIHFLNTGYGACIHFCALTEMLLNRSGYATHWVRGELGHYWLLVEMSPGVWRHMDTMRKNYHVYNLTDAEVLAKHDNPYGVNFHFDTGKWTSSTTTGLGDGSPAPAEEPATQPAAETTEGTQAPPETTVPPATEAEETEAPAETTPVPAAEPTQEPPQPSEPSTEVPATEAPSETPPEVPATEAPAETSPEVPATEAPTETTTEAWTPPAEPPASQEVESTSAEH